MQVCHFNFNWYRAHFLLFLSPQCFPTNLPAINAKRFYWKADLHQLKNDWTRVQQHHSHARCCGSQHHLGWEKKAIQQPLEVVQQGTSRVCAGERADSQVDCQLDYHYAVEGHGSASALLHECGRLSPTPSLIELPNLHHIEEHVATSLPGVKTQACGCIAANTIVCYSSYSQYSTTPLRSIIMCVFGPVCVHVCLCDRERKKEERESGRKCVLIFKGLIAFYPMACLFCKRNPWAMFICKDYWWDKTIWSFMNLNFDQKLETKVAL